jgi:hypothetical protein
MARSVEPGSYVIEVGSDSAHLVPADLDVLPL